MNGKKRYMEEKIFKVLMILSLAIVMASLGIVIGITVIKGGDVLIEDPTIIITPPGPKYLLGGEGGFLHAILGSLYMVIPATGIATLIAIGIALFLQSDYSSPKISEKIRTSLDILWGTPSIVYGIFVLTLLIYMQQRGCLLIGIIALSLLELPIITRYADEAIQSVPLELKEMTYSMGTTRLETAKVITKYALPGIVAGTLIGMGRGIGDAASIMFTVGASDVMPSGLFHSTTALPVLIFQQANSFYPSVRAHTYAAAFVLVVMILSLSFTSRILTKHFSRYVKR